jgi:hypothetical protein
LLVLCRFKGHGNEYEVAKIVNSVRLLKEREVRALVPEGPVYKEKVVGSRNPLWV